MEALPLGIGDEDLAPIPIEHDPPSVRRPVRRTEATVLPAHDRTRDTARRRNPVQRAAGEDDRRPSGGPGRRRLGARLLASSASAAAVRAISCSPSTTRRSRSRTGRPVGPAPSGGSREPAAERAVTHRPLRATPRAAHCHRLVRRRGSAPTGSAGNRCSDRNVPDIAARSPTAPSRSRPSHARQCSGTRTASADPRLVTDHSLPARD